MGVDKGAGRYLGISICCAIPQNVFTRNKLLQSEDLKALRHPYSTLWEFVNIIPVNFIL